MSPVRKEQLTWMPISKLVALKRNPQYCTPAQMESLKTSIEQDGFVVPILIRKLPRKKDRYEIVSGNHRVMAAREIGLTEVPCVLIRLSDKQTKRLAVNLNTIHGEPNPELLAPFLAEMEDDVLASIHLEQNELDKLLEFDDALERHLRALQPPKSHDANPVVTTYRHCRCPTCGKRHVPPEDKSSEDRTAAAEPDPEDDLPLPQ